MDLMPQTPRGTTNSMKTAVSIPDEVFEQVEKLAKRTKKSRSRLFTDALREYVARHSPDEITEEVSINGPAGKARSEAPSLRRLAGRCHAGDESVGGWMGEG